MGGLGKAFQRGALPSLTYRAVIVARIRRLIYLGNQCYNKVSSSEESMKKPCQVPRSPGGVFLWQGGEMDREDRFFWVVVLFFLGWVLGLAMMTMRHMG